MPGIVDVPPVPEELASESDSDEAQVEEPAAPVPEQQAQVEALAAPVPEAGTFSRFSFVAERKRRPGAGRPRGTFGSAHVRALLRAAPPVQFAAPPASAC